MALPARAAELGRIDASGVARYFPLTLGAAWVYQVVVDGKPAPDPLQILVSGIASGAPSQPPGYVVTVTDLTIPPEERNAEPLVYVFHGAGELVCVNCGGLILKAPLDRDASWPMEPDADKAAASPTTRIIETGASVTQDGHTWTDCVVTVVSQPDSGVDSEITYAPNVGPVRMRYRHLADAPGTWFREEHLTDFRIMVPPHLPQAVGRG